MASEREPEMRDVTCRGCGAINPVQVGIYASGIKTVFCKGCGEEIQLVYKRTPAGLELKRARDLCTRKGEKPDGSSL